MSLLLPPRAEIKGELRLKACATIQERVGVRVRVCSPVRIVGPDLAQVSHLQLGIV